MMEIRLTSNPSTGYNWNLNISNINILELVCDDYNSNNELIGSGGVKLYRFNILNEGEVTLTFCYERSWEKQEEPLTINYILHVKDDLQVEVKEMKANKEDQDVPLPTFN